jgi:hypothetical protein
MSLLTPSSPPGGSDVAVAVSMDDDFHSISSAREETASDRVAIPSDGDVPIEFDPHLLDLDECDDTGDVDDGDAFVSPLLDVVDDGDHGAIPLESAGEPARGDDSVMLKSVQELFLANGSCKIEIFVADVKVCCRCAMMRRLYCA